MVPIVCLLKTAMAVLSVRLELELEEVMGLRSRAF